jgi:hypothetical protein
MYNILFSTVLVEVDLKYNFLVIFINIMDIVKLGTP